MALDTETSGFANDGGSEELIQIGIKMASGRSFYRHYLPTGQISAKAVDTHGITLEKL